MKASSSPHKGQKEYSYRCIYDRAVNETSKGIQSNMNQLEKLEAARSAFLLIPLATFPGLTRPYWALLCFTWPYLALHGLNGPYWALHGITGPYWILLGHTGPYWALLGLTWPYLALLGLTRPYFAFV